MLQYIIFFVAVHIFLMLQYMFFDVALHIFAMLQCLYSDVALHSFFFLYAVIIGGQSQIYNSFFISTMVK
jgi:hypothetical protein